MLPTHAGSKRTRPTKTDRRRAVDAVWPAAVWPAAVWQAPSRSSRRIVLMAGLLACLFSIPAQAQWIYRDPSAPRARDGTVDVRAPAPRTAGGMVDLSG